MGEATSPVEAILPARSRQRVLLTRTLAILVGLVFVYAGGIKLIHPLQFASDITNYQIVPWAVAISLALYLPWLEIFCGLALIFYRLLEGALSLTIGLMLLFIGVSISAKARGLDITCGCFGSASSSLSFSWHFLLDLLLLAVLVYLWFSARRSRSRSLKGGAFAI
jgi:hypothetical protein